MLIFATSKFLEEKLMKVPLLYLLILCVLVKQANEVFLHFFVDVAVSLEGFASLLVP